MGSGEVKRGSADVDKNSSIGLTPQSLRIAKNTRNINAQIVNM